MDFEIVRNSVVQFVQAHQGWAPFVLGLMTFGESLAFVSLLLPTMTILIAVGFILSAAGIPFWEAWAGAADRKSTRLNSSHANISYAVFCLKKKKNTHNR